MESKTDIYSIRYKNLNNKYDQYQGIIVENTKQLLTIGVVQDNKRNGYAFLEKKYIDKIEISRKVCISEVSGEEIEQYTKVKLVTAKVILKYAKRLDKNITLVKNTGVKIFGKIEKIGWNFVIMNINNKIEKITLKDIIYIKYETENEAIRNLFPELISHQKKKIGDVYEEAIQKIFDMKTETTNIIKNQYIEIEGKDKNKEFYQIKINEKTEPLEDKLLNIPGEASIITKELNYPINLYIYADKGYIEHIDVFANGEKIPNYIEDYIIKVVDVNDRVI